MSIYRVLDEEEAKSFRVIRKNPITYINTKVRLIEDASLRQIGTVDKGHCIIERRHLLERQYMVAIFGILAILLLVTTGIRSHQLSKENTAMRAELEEYQALNMDKEYINVLTLAGKYATSKSKVPTSMDSVFKVVVESGAWYPDIIMAQFIIESASGTSGVARNANNFYGMKKCGEGPRSRPNLQLPGTNYSGYGMYMNWQHSVLDRVLWDMWMFGLEDPGSRDNYLDRLDGRYAEDPDYIAKVRSIADQWVSKIGTYKVKLSDTAIWNGIPR